MLFNKTLLFKNLPCWNSASHYFDATLIQFKVDKNSIDVYAAQFFFIMTPHERQSPTNFLTRPLNLKAI